MSVLPLVDERTLDMCSDYIHGKETKKVKNTYTKQRQGKVN